MRMCSVHTCLGGCSKACMSKESSYQSFRCRTATTSTLGSIKLDIIPSLQLASIHQSTIILLNLLSDTFTQYGPLGIYHTTSHTPNHWIGILPSSSSSTGGGFKCHHSTRLSTTHHRYFDHLLKHREGTLSSVNVDPLRVEKDDAEVSTVEKQLHTARGRSCCTATTTKKKNVLGHLGNKSHQVRCDTFNCSDVRCKNECGR
mmetsp:Transcript_16012/g.32180  ORF Transcript_16012/g.32180 Transcript_16012/m.32180 type:complete len:202 (+) Transcript_16012:3900-4505(+)